MSCLTRRGYRIGRTEENMKYIENLTLHPEEQSKNSYNDFKEPVLAYRKTKSYIFIPRHYGYLEFGKPDRYEQHFYRRTSCPQVRSCV